MLFYHVWMIIANNTPDSVCVRDRDAEPDPAEK